ncbi:ATP-binding cassette domain-containing protein [Paenibacillus nanensis]|uniref:ATP-binding cassette domain-containing protein n=2 Tax=Paenibacillus nanensis TaxID=393251 RepID=A0A3A1UV78_9BACL|nr:ATP-binding cassette domain-containing protein [Paenibacillus nanensis]
MAKPSHAAPILELRQVGFRYPGAEADSLRGISLTVEPGEFVAIAGTNGSGKSTLCKCLNGLIPHYYVGDLTGHIEIAGLTAANESVSTLSRKVAYVFQDFENQLVRPTVYDEAIFAPLNFGYEDYKSRGERALAMLGLQHLRDRWIWQLSGGQKHLTALAGVLSLDPDILIIDEPVAQLDPHHARLIYDKLKVLNEQYGKTIIVIEHHTEFIAEYCSKVVLMDQGTIRWTKPVKEALSSVQELAELNILPPQVTMSAYLLDPNKRDYPVTLEEAEAYFRQFPLRPEALQDAAAAQLKKDNAGAVQTLADFRQVSYGYRTVTRTIHPVIQNAELQLREDDRVALVGNNGAGKSTLLKLISGLIKPLSGMLTVCGMDTRQASPEKLADYVAYIHQNPEEMFIEDTVRKDIEYFLKSRKLLHDPSFIDDIVDRLHLQEVQHRDGRLLSGGQQRRATLAIALAMRPAVILLDEPTASLDAASRRELSGMLIELRDRVKLTVIATHDMQLVAEWANRVIVLHDGEIVMDTDPLSLFSQPGLLRMTGLVAPQATTLSHQLGIRPPAMSAAQVAAAFNCSGEREEGIVQWNS